MNFHIISLFPESFDSYINSSIIGRAISDKYIKIKFYNPRDFVKLPKSQKGKDKPYLRVDAKPYGGGPGMVMQAEPIIKTIEKILKKITPPTPLTLRGEPKKKDKPLIIWLSPSAKTFDNGTAEKFKKYKDIVIICGRYEGIDERVKKIFKPEEVSIGTYVLTGGELPAMVILDSISRRIPGVLGNMESVEENRVASRDVYTRPEILEHKGKKYRVPKVLLSGNHAKIEEWRSKKK